MNDNVYVNVNFMKFQIVYVLLSIAEDPGVLTSNSWIRLSIDGEEMFDWKGPCGRNDEGRIPTFRTGYSWVLHTRSSSLYSLFNV